MSDTRRETVQTQDEADRELWWEAVTAERGEQSRPDRLIMADLANALRNRIDSDPHGLITLVKGVVIFAAGVLVGGGLSIVSAVTR